MLILPINEISYAKSFLFVVSVFITKKKKCPCNIQIFFCCTNGNFNILVQSIDCEFTEAVGTSTHNLRFAVFDQKKRKNTCTIYHIKVEFKEV